jgi:hypothetical protein
VRPQPAFGVDELAGATAEVVVRRLGEPDRIQQGDVWWSPELRQPVVFRSGELVPEVVYGPVPGEIAPGTPYELWYYTFGEELPESARAFLGPGAVDPDGETWYLYLAGEGGEKKVFELTSYGNSVMF